jgi:hypothetical protein
MPLESEPPRNSRQDTDAARKDTGISESVASDSPTPGENTTDSERREFVDDNPHPESFSNHGHTFEQDEPRQSRGGIGRFLGPLAGGALLLGKLKGLIGALKFLTILKSGGSLLLFVAVEAFAFGWPSAVVITALLVTLSLGRLFALRLQRRPASPMVFIPFLGGGAGARTRGEVATEDAFVAIMGPVFGTGAALGLAAAYATTDQKFWLVMASIAFTLNLFQILPAPGLAGGSIALMISPKLLLPGIVVLLLVAWQSIIVWFIALMALPYAIAMWKAKPSEDPYLARVTSADRWKYGLTLLAIAVVLGLGSRFCDDRLHELRELLG